MATEMENPEDRPTGLALVVAAWLVVGIPLLYGLWQTLLKAFQLLGG